MKADRQSINRKLTISEMARIHNITRQTLIYYDKIGLFRPDITEANGYRFYSTLQIPQLNEICFLRSVGISLDDIRKSAECNNSESTIRLLQNRTDEITSQIQELTNQLHEIEHWVNSYRSSKAYTPDNFQPIIRTFPERKVFFHEWDNDSLNRHGLFYALMNCWNLAEGYGLLPTKHYGALFFYKNVKNGIPLQRAGTCCMISAEIPAPENSKYIENVFSLRAGEYACMYKFGMPYDMKSMERLLDWMDQNNYELDGRVYDECLMDGIFYTDNDVELDFCELQIPIKKREQKKD